MLELSLAHLVMQIVSHVLEHRQVKCVPLANLDTIQQQLQLHALNVITDVNFAQEQETQIAKLCQMVGTKIVQLR